MKLSRSALSSALPLVLLVGCGGGDGFAEPDNSVTSSGGATASGGQASGSGGSAAGGTSAGGAGATGGTAVGSGGTVTTPGATGEYTFKTGSVSVAPGGEVYKCQDFPNPFGKDIGVVEMETDLTPGSHHMFAFVIAPGEATLTSGLADCPSGGVEFHEYLTTSGSPKAVTQYPSGVGRVFSSGTALRLNVHLYNTADEPRDAFVTFKVKYVDPATLENRAAAIFLNNLAVRVPPGKSTTTGTYTLPEDINMLGAASHMHKQGVHFIATTDTGETLYEGTEWEEPPIKVYSPPLHLAAGTKITWACSYENPTSRTLGFGESAADNEMCIFPGEFFNEKGGQLGVQLLF